MPKSVNINAIIGDLSDMLSRAVGEQIQIETHLANGFHDVLLVATAQVHGHFLLTKRDAVFGAWTGVKLASPWARPPRQTSCCIR